MSRDISPLGPSIAGAIMAYMRGSSPGKKSAIAGWAVSRRVAFLQWALPTLILLFVVLYQTVFVGYIHDLLGAEGHYVVEVVFYGAMGPLVTFFVLAWIRRWLLEKEQIEQTIREQEKRMALIRVEEGKRVAQHLHREVLPNLAYVANKIDHTRTKLLQPQGHCAQADAELTKVTATLRETVGELREKINALRKGLPLVSLKRETNLVEELQRRLEEFKKLLHIDVRISLQGQERGIPHELESSLWRIIGEGLNNVALHAQARQGEIQLDFGNPRQVEVRITDNGIGFDAPAALEHPSGLGLIHMQEETQRHGGSLQVISQRGKGTTIVAVFSLDEESRLS